MRPYFIDTLPNVNFKIPDGATWNYGTNAHVANPLGLGLAYSYTIVPAISGSWLNFDSSSGEFRILSSNSSIIGNYIVIFNVGNFFGTATEAFTISIYDPSTPYSIGNIDDVQAEVGNPFDIILGNVNDLFVDPSNSAMTATVTDSHGGALPSSLHFHPSNFSLTSDGSNLQSGIINLKYTATNAFNSSADIDFNVIVKSCYFTCSSCTGEEYNECTS